MLCAGIAGPFRKHAVWCFLVRGQPPKRVNVCAASTVSGTSRSVDVLSLDGNRIGIAIGNERESKRVSVQQEVDAVLLRFIDAMSDPVDELGAFI